MHRITLRVALLAGVAVALSTVSLGAAPAAADATSTVVHLGHGTDDLHAVTMGLGIATVLAKVCSHCAEAGALTAEQLRAGARIGSDDEVAARLLAADRILDY